MKTTTPPSATFLKVKPTQAQLDDLQRQLKQIHDDFGARVGDFTNKYILEDYFYEMVDEQIDLCIGNDHLISENTEVDILVNAKGWTAYRVGVELIPEQVSKLNDDLKVYFEENEIEIQA